MSKIVQNLPREGEVSGKIASVGGSLIIGKVLILTKLQLSVNSYFHAATGIPSRSTDIETACDWRVIQ